MSLITEIDLKKATGEKTLAGLIKWCKKNAIPYFKTRNGLATTTWALNNSLSEHTVDGGEPDMSKVI